MRFPNKTPKGLALIDAFLAEARKCLEKSGRDWRASDTIYRHFEDKKEIEYVLVRIGFRELLEASANFATYVSWAERNPELYTLMFSPSMRAGVENADRFLEFHGPTSIHLWNLGCKEAAQ